MTKLPPHCGPLALTCGVSSNAGSRAAAASLQQLLRQQQQHSLQQRHFLGTDAGSGSHSTAPPRPDTAATTHAAHQPNRDDHKPLRKRIANARERAQDKLDDAKERYEGAKERAQEHYEDAKDRYQDAKDRARERYQDAKSDMQENIDEAKERARERVETTKAQARETAEAGARTMREMWRRYGIVSVGTYLTVYVLTLGGFYLVFDHGFMTEGDMPAAAAHAADTLQAVVARLPEWAQVKVEALYSKMQQEPGFRNFVLAWLTAKVTEPARVVITLGITPRVARAVGRAPAKIPKKR